MSEQDLKHERSLKNLQSIEKKIEEKIINIKSSNIHIVQLQYDG